MTQGNRTVSDVLFPVDWLQENLEETTVRTSSDRVNLPRLQPGQPRGSDLAHESWSSAGLLHRFSIGSNFSVTSWSWWKSCAWEIGCLVLVFDYVEKLLGVDYVLILCLLTNLDDDSWLLMAIRDLSRYVEFICGWEALKHSLQLALRFKDFKRNKQNIRGSEPLPPTR